MVTGFCPRDSFRKGRSSTSELSIIAEVPNAPFCGSQGAQSLFCGYFEFWPTQKPNGFRTKKSCKRHDINKNVTTHSQTRNEAQTSTQTPNHCRDFHLLLPFWARSPTLILSNTWASDGARTTAKKARPRKKTGIAKPNITHIAGFAVLFNKDTFHSDVRVNSVYIHDTRTGQQQVVK